MVSLRIRTSNKTNMVQIKRSKPHERKWGKASPAPRITYVSPSYPREDGSRALRRQKELQGWLKIRGWEDLENKRPMESNWRETREQQSSRLRSWERVSIKITGWAARLEGKIAVAPLGPIDIEGIQESRAIREGRMICTRKRREERRGEEKRGGEEGFSFPVSIFLIGNFESQIFHQWRRIFGFFSFSCFQDPLA